MKKALLSLGAVLFLFSACGDTNEEEGVGQEDLLALIDEATGDIDGERYPTLSTSNYTELSAGDLAGGYHHTRHEELFGDKVSGFNSYIIEAMDIVQATAPSGGGYFADQDAIPYESPIGYELSLFGNALIDPPRTTSFCTGASYAVLIEALNLIYPENPELTSKQLNAFMMQEDDGTPREDYVRFWGSWNAPYGPLLSLVEYSGMGKRVDPDEAVPGDFVYFERTNGLGHCVVFLGFYVNYYGEKMMIYFSSQEQTLGIGDGFTSVNSIDSAVFVRLTDPDKLFTFNPEKQIEVAIEGDSIGW